MALKVEYEVTSEHPCQIPVLGTFEAGETKEIDDLTLTQFEAIMGHKLGASRLPTWAKLTATLGDTGFEVDVVSETDGTEV